MPNCIILVGLPGSGKTTWRENFLNQVSQNSNSEWIVISSDDIIENYAEDRGITYAQAFSELKGRIGTLTASSIASAKLHGLNVIWDQTNLTKKKRQVIQNALPAYTFYYVSFLDVPLETIRERNEARKATGRNIPDSVLEQMINHANAEFPNTMKEVPRSLSVEFGDFHD